MMAESRNDGTKEEATTAIQWHSKRYFYAVPAKEEEMGGWKKST
jgi:hypothetical protein